jgi:hypothetical protein
MLSAKDAGTQVRITLPVIYRVNVVYRMLVIDDEEWIRKGILSDIEAPMILNQGLDGSCYIGTNLKYRIRNLVVAYPWNCQKAVCRIQPSCATRRGSENGVKPGCRWLTIQ